MSLSGIPSLSRLRRLVGPRSRVQPILELLPLDDAELEARIEALHLEREPSDPVNGGRAADRCTADEIRLLRAANRHARALTSLARPAMPAAEEHPDGIGAESTAADLFQVVGDRAALALRDVLTHALGPVPVPTELRRRDALDSCREEIVRESEARLRSRGDVDLIAAGFAPVVAPADADWAASALEELEERGGATARSFTIGPLNENGGVRTPGWLWARIRGGVHVQLASIRKPAIRRRSTIRFALAAAGLLGSTLVYVMVSSRTGSGADRPEIVFQRVDQPLSDQFSTAAVIRRVRDVR